jgi:hypothetical protein
MARVSRTLVVVLIALSTPGLAWAEEGYGDLTPDNRPTGFMIEVDLAASMPVYSELLMEFGMVGFSSIVPQLALGAQIGRFGIGARAGISMFGYSSEETEYDEGDKLNMWAIRIGPHVDGEIWGSGRGALYLYGGIDVLLYRESDENEDDTDPSATGFSIDFGIGGRLYVARVFSIGLQVGTTVDATFWKITFEEESEEWRTVVWSLYGALAFRFVTAR